jgi:uncharacterized protein (DUF2236 family)
MWPADRKAFDECWQQSLERVRIDDVVREYLYPIAAGRVRGVTRPNWLQRRLDTINLFITTGFLPQRFRDEMRLPWDAVRQRRFNRLMATLGTVNNAMPRFVRRFPFNRMLKDLDWRIRTGRPWPSGARPTL